jgi:hypothetical protein
VSILTGRNGRGTTAYCWRERVVEVLALSLPDMVFLSLSARVHAGCLGPGCLGEPHLRHASWQRGAIRRDARLPAPRCAPVR